MILTYDGILMPYPLPKHEKKTVEDFQLLIEQLREEVLKNKEPFMLFEDEITSDYEKGVLAAISFIQFRIDSILIT